MDFLNYFFISLIIYSGLLMGIIISYMAKEEIKPGKRYFILLHNLVLGFLMFFILEFFKVNAYLTLFIPLIFIIGLFYYNNTYKKSYITYPVLGFLYYLTSAYFNQQIMIASLIFFYGIIIGSLQIDFKKKNYMGILSKNLLFFICLALFFI